MQRALDAPQAPSSLTLLSLLQRAQTTILHLYENQTTHDNLSTILTALNNNLKTTTHSPLPKTWAQAASQGQLAMPSLPPIPTESHVILVRMGAEEDQEKVKKSTNKEIL